MAISFHKRADNWASLRVSYSLSKSLDDVALDEFLLNPQNNFNVRDDQGLSDNDERHRLVSSGTLEVPRTANESQARRLLRGFQFGYIFTYASRLPFNVLLGSDHNFTVTAHAGLLHAIFAERHAALERLLANVPSCLLRNSQLGVESHAT